MLIATPLEVPSATALIGADWSDGTPLVGMAGFCSNRSCRCRLKKELKQEELGGGGFWELLYYLEITTLSPINQYIFHPTQTRLNN